MNREELLNIHETLCNKSRALMRKKNADYAGGRGVEPFANFTRCEAMGICKTEAGMLVRMTDKMSRLSSFLESGKFEVADESLEDTTLDIINYAVLLYAYVADKKNVTENSTSAINLADTNKGQVFLKETSVNEQDVEGHVYETRGPVAFRNGCCNGSKSGIDTPRETLGSNPSSRITR
jgi:hypothetical protein